MAPPPLERKKPPPQAAHIVPPLDFGLPSVALPPVAAEPPATVAPPPPAPMPVVPPPAPPVTPAVVRPVTPVAPPPVAVLRPVAQGALRVVEPAAIAKGGWDQWHELAHALARQLWNERSPYPLRTVVMETFLRAMPILVVNREAQSAATATYWREPFVDAGTEQVARLDRAEFEGSAARTAEVIERWMQHQETLARQPGSDAEHVSFSVSTLKRSAVVTFGMDFSQRGVRGRKRVACWIGRSGEDQFLFAGKLPPPGTALSSGAALERAYRAGQTATEPSVPLPREVIMGLPAPVGVDTDAAMAMRRLIINFCEAYFARFDNRLGAELYDHIRRRRDIARTVLPEVLGAMPPSKEKRMLQQVYRDL